MFGITCTRVGILAYGFGLIAIFTTTASAQYGNGGGAMSGNAGAGNALHNNYHLGFDRPEAWGLKYFASTSLLSGLALPDLPEGHKVGALTVGLELGWLPTLDSGQTRIGYNGTAPEDLNKAPVLARAYVKVGLPGRFSFLAAAPPPFEAFGVTSHLFAFGIERPLLERQRWTLTWRGYGQVGSVTGAFTCPSNVLAFAPGSATNPTRCVGKSSDVASLRYAGSEFQFAYRIRRLPKIVPHIAVGGNFIDGVFHVHAPLENGLDETRLWTRGGTFSTSWGVSYAVSKKASFVVDAFYSPLWVQRTLTSPATNDGLFNLRALLSYTFH